MDKYVQWLINTNNDQKTQEELLRIQDDAQAIEDRFYKELSFGTGGLRGKIGAGTNRMNVYSVGKATRGLANYIVNNGIKKSVAIAYDSRNMSKEFSQIAAEILSQNGIEVYLFDRLMPTPVLSYAVRKLQTGMGIVITASHNPKEYNGYKVYNDKGCQITDETAALISQEIAKCGYFEKVIGDASKIHCVGDALLDDFLREIKRYSFVDTIENAPKIVYTPLNGTGKEPVKKLLAMMDLHGYSMVPQQEEPDGNFTTCPYPNPEEREALSLAVELAKRENAELVIATDPDADRVGIAVKDGQEFRLLDGNQTGVLLAEYIFANLRKTQKMPNNPYMVKTIVTTDLAGDIAQAYGVQCKDVLTGFKYIGETIDRFPEESFVFGMEESYGYLVGTHARDKDAVSAVMMIVEMVAYYSRQGISLSEQLTKLYQTYGYYSTKLLSKTFEGKSGMEYMRNFMQKLRENPMQEIVGYPALAVKDYAQGIEGLPKSDVIKIVCQDVSMVIRPSGTEPKIKIYLTAKADTEEKSTALLQQLNEFANELLS